MIKRNLTKSIFNRAFYLRAVAIEHIDWFKRGI